MTQYEGRAIKYDDDNINTDAIMSNEFLARYGMDPLLLGKHCFANYDPAFCTRARAGDILVAGRNFGCGSSKPAGIALMGAGVRVVIARSFSRMFFRNAINLGMLPVESEDAVDGIRDGDLLRVDMGEMTVENKSTGKRYQTERYPQFIQEIMEAGGILDWARKKGESISGGSL